MNNVIRKSTNKWSKGLVLDFSPENTNNEVLTHALNATLLTLNGNEMSLQNDMGNARVESAYLPEGYIPVGTCEYGGIIYIVSYNPLEDKSQIGCFPSPERNISNEELGISDVKIENGLFQSTVDELISGDITNTSYCAILKNDSLNPGDKFLIYANGSILNEKLLDLYKKDDKGSFTPIQHPILALNVVSIEDSGKIVYLNSGLRQYETELGSDKYTYYIVGKSVNDGSSQNKIDIDSYRSVLSSGYNVFKSKTSGKLAILAELIAIDSYSITHSVEPRKSENGDELSGCFDVIIHTEISPEVTAANYTVVPKLKYYYLKESNGTIQSLKDGIATKVKLFDDDGTISSEFMNTKLSDMFEQEGQTSTDLSKTLSETGKYNFPKKDSYHCRLDKYENSLDNVNPEITYTKFSANKFYKVTVSQIKDNIHYYLNELKAKFYKKNGNLSFVLNKGDVDNNLIYYIKKAIDKYVNVDHNENYKTETLYKLESVLRIATDLEIANTNIEKFIYKKTTEYEEATEDDLKNNQMLLYVYNKGIYTPVLTIIEGVTYYKKVVSQQLESVGKIINTPYTETYYIYGKTNNYIIAEDEDIELYWNGNSDLILYYKTSQEQYRVATEAEINYCKELWYYDNYEFVENFDKLSENEYIFMILPFDCYVDNTKFIPNNNNHYSAATVEDGEPISLYSVAEFLPEQVDAVHYEYSDYTLASIEFPSELTKDYIDFPFKYSYSLVPCMNYGRLNHLTVSNTVDFNKLYDFDKSEFNVWKYHIDNNQLRLTFGAEIYDTFEPNKVDALVLEFYDCWGFAGSLEITNKKSYTGVFTKMIPLNTIGALSTKRIDGNSYINTFKRNINIKNEGESFTFNGESVFFQDYKNGWCYSNSNSKSGLSNSDCGVLYSNILYTVKPYIRRTINGDYDFIEKSEFFLYTLPIYNDYYYTTSDFNKLINPLLNLTLTYKIQDSSNIIPYNRNSLNQIPTKPNFKTEDINDGYYASDQDLMSKYTSGNLKGVSQIDTIRYYKYEGISEIFLEIGLSEDYSKLNLGYSPDINNYFSCTLQLLSDSSDRSYVVKGDNTSETLSEEHLLNYTYKDKNLDLSINQLGFNIDYTSTIDITSDSFRKHNFMYPRESSTPIDLRYKFVVGYPITISNIRDTSIPVTTVCALCHKDDDGNYNYEDFGVYIQPNPNNENVSWYLSNSMLYNGGTASREIFGVCRQVDISYGTNMGQQCISKTVIESESQVTKTPGKLNTGNPLQHCLSYIGKLTFCQPHAHSLNENSGVSIHGDNKHKYFGLPAEISTDNDITGGTLPWYYLYQNPRYNMCLNTKNSINYQSEFISTLDCKTLADKDQIAFHKGSVWIESSPVREYTGLDGSEIEQFNKKMIQTMKNVYAYNPDYNYMSITAGDINIADYKPKFVSNLTSCKSTLTFENGQTLNDFIYFGPMCVSDYIKFMYEHSINSKDIKLNLFDENQAVKKQITFTPNLSYCGEGDNNVLLTSLTYNTQTPIDLEESLTFRTNGSTVVRKENGDILSLDGIPNNKVLYGFDSSSKKLVALDVSNYEIDVYGDIHIKQSTSAGELEHVLEVTPDIANTAVSGMYKKSDVIDFNVDLEPSEFFVNTQITISEDGSAIASAAVGNKPCVYVSSTKKEFSNENIQLLVKVAIPPSPPTTITPIVEEAVDSFTYAHEVMGLEFSINGVILNSDVFVNGYSANGYIGLKDLSSKTLHDLIFIKSGDITIKKIDGTELETNFISHYLAPYHTEVGGILINKTINKGENIKYNGAGFDFSFGSSSVTGIELYEINLSKIHIKTSRSRSLKSDPNSIINTTKTKNYGKVNSSTHAYMVYDEYKKSCLRGTSLTINDLVYEPNPNGHRLFVQNSSLVYDDYLRNRLYYRESKNNAKAYTYSEDDYKNEWEYTDTNKYLNTLFLYTGPCFTKDNLNSDN